MYKKAFSGYSIGYLKIYFQNMQSKKIILKILDGKASYTTGLVFSMYAKI
jgi:hypothetical protein